MIKRFDYYEITTICCTSGGIFLCKIAQPMSDAFPSIRWGPYG
jgi:hypothetical protein